MLKAHHYKQFEKLCKNRKTAKGMNTLLSEVLNISEEFHRKWLAVKNTRKSAGPTNDFKQWPLNWEGMDEIITKTVDYSRIFLEGEKKRAKPNVKGLAEVRDKLAELNEKWQELKDLDRWITARLQA
ncbi:uncharacterized protein F5Z01DRAFT_636761 [Emericellopsis atlantica]|uniref:Uncharacterized protein n=1 Tax=Emericellopsis atlantica TaxID=2614577 RepID=A0A9P8CPG3_9HYPO|nr:uncharacterized protein F5Z01DRAFT_636761 [Emericellopsis atlantica]KAG9254100.1 hypothetical protein F5Z01DRAFT_636761 [Emericellopsis atlantica]